MDKVEVMAYCEFNVRDTGSSDFAMGRIMEYIEDNGSSESDITSKENGGRSLKKAGMNI